MMLKNQMFSRRLRSATVLVAVLVCLAVASLILFATVKVSSGHRRQIRQELQIEQTRWMVDAGVRKALAEIASDKNYSGDQFSVSPLLKYGKAKLEIEVVADNEGAAALLKISASVNRGEDELTETNRTAELKVTR